MRSIAVLTLAVLVLFSLAFAPPAPVQAADAVCTAVPSSGPPGTTFVLTVSGFSPNAQLWTYAVDPSGAAFADPVNGGFGGGVRTNVDGTASFTFSTRFIEGDTGTEIARELGAWTLVAQETAPGNVIVHEAHCSVFITPSGAAAPTGASLTVTPEQGFNDQVFVITGTGFAPHVAVNLWLTPPSLCDAYAFDLQGQTLVHAAADAFSFGTAFTDASGGFAYSLLPNTFSFCTGQWAVTAREPTSGQGGVATFVLTGHVTTPTGAVLSVNPSVTSSRGGTLTFTGSGYEPNEVVVCWYTRPEGSVRELPALKANGAGAFSFVYVTGFDGFSGSSTTIVPDMQYSEGSVGDYWMSCLGQASRSLAITMFTLVGNVTDP